jgi:hypothetical protein
MLHVFIWEALANMTRASNIDIADVALHGVICDQRTRWFIIYMSWFTMVL